MIVFGLLGLAPGDDAESPPPDAPDRVLVQWLEARLGRLPVWFEVLELRSLLRALVRRWAWWAWWRRFRPLRLPAREDLVADFLALAEGQLLLRALGGSMAALVAQLRLPDPFAGYDGRHPTASRPTRLERLRERVAGGGAVPLWAQAEAATAYATWKVTGVPVLAPGLMPERVDFLAPAHAAALNVLSPGAAMAFAARLRAARCSEAGRRAALGELARIGTEAMELWPDVARRSATPPLGLWPPAAPEDGAPPRVAAPAPRGGPSP
ncbi:hypothetical protein RGI145_07885 [Roseomonas gilardii]|uniref:Uncharacterized protein n=1 Tax=Roseomonas gilardii TaxID=257708 RepID=A0A1L7AE19_9PROT|nr:hypothetical protein [Roseomonas gilardii]APT57022.1 hypothetical protein RGI145_07885 [Roseomonas gilardii]